MKAWKRILPIVLAIITVCSICWYLFVYDIGFTRDVLLSQARILEHNGNHKAASWLYDLAYRQSGNNAQVAIELAEVHRQNGNYTQAEYTLSNAIASHGTMELYIALCQTYVEQDKLLDAVTMLDRVNSEFKEQLNALRPSAPVATPTPGFYNQYLTVTVESSGGTLYVSCDGEYPSIHKDLYESGIALESGETTMYAVSIGENGLVSPLSIFGYTLGGVVEEVTLADTALDSHVRQTLGIGSGVKLMTSDLWKITSLTLPADVTTLSDLQYFPYLTELVIPGGGFSDFQCFATLANLETLSVTGCTVSTQDIATISAMPKLKHLTLSNCMISSIQNLAGAEKLESLDLSGNTVRDASALSNMAELKELNLSQNALTNLSYLSGLSKLTKLNVSYNSLTAVDALAGLTLMTELDISHNSIEALEGLSGMTVLEKLIANHNKLAGADSLSVNTALTELDLSNNSIGSITALSTLTKVQTLNVSYNKLTALPAFPTSCALVMLDASNNQLKDVSPLEGMSSLNTVVLDNNSISSITPLTKCSNLIRVDITNNPVKNVTALKELSVQVNYSP